MSFQPRTFLITLSPENTKKLIYKDKIFPIDYYLLQRNSEYFKINDTIFNSLENIRLLEDEPNSIDFPIQSIQEFVKCCQNQPIEINHENIFYLKYLAKKYKVSKLEAATIDIISNDKEELALDSLLFSSKINSEKYFPNVDTSEEENIISAHFSRYMKDERLFNLSIPILYRIVKNYYQNYSTISDNEIQSNEEEDVNNDEFADFLFKLLDKYPKDASIFFEFFDITKNRIKDVVKLHDNYSEHFNPAFLNSSLFDTTVTLIKEMAALKDEMAKELIQMKRFRAEQKEQMENFKAELIEKTKFCIDPSSKTDITVSVEYTLPYDAYVCCEMTACHHGVCYVSVNGIDVQQQGAEYNQRCRSPVAIICKKGDKVKLYSNNQYGSFTYACYYALK